MNFLPNNYSEPEDNEDFMGIRTHSRYAMNIFKLIENKKIIFDLAPSSDYRNLTSEQKILNKLEIVKYTLNSIRSENIFAKQDEDFLSMSLSWLWIKGYYAVFHLASLLIAFEKNDSRYMINREYNSHGKILSIINQIITSKQPFNVPELNSTYSGAELLMFKDKNYLNLKDISSFKIDLLKLSLKKIYSEEVKLKLKGTKGIKRHELLNKINSKRYAIFDLFHYYRERFNYAGFQYLDCDEKPANSFELKKFYHSSYSIVIAISTSLVNYLIGNTTGIIKKKLNEIKQII